MSRKTKIVLAITFMIACLGYVFVQLWQQPF